MSVSNWILTPLAHILPYIYEHYRNKRVGTQGAILSPEYESRGRIRNGVDITKFTKRHSLTGMNRSVRDERPLASERLAAVGANKLFRRRLGNGGILVGEWHRQWMIVGVLIVSVSIVSVLIVSALHHSRFVFGMRITRILY